MNRTKHLAVSVVFFLFALVQYNDPDFVVWLLVYLSVSGMALMAYFDQYFMRIYLCVFFVLFIWFITYIPHLVSWIQDGWSNIAGSMKAESMYIELVRECFGLLLCLIAVAYYYMLSKKMLR